MQEVVIVDYGLCNLDSIARAIEECGARSFVTAKAADLDDADKIVLPGVGSFRQAMANLTEAGFDRALPEAVCERQVPILGICLGMHLMAQSGSEGGDTAGLGLLSGDVKRMTPLESNSRVRLPHIGWNDVSPRPDFPLFDGIDEGTDFYFVHGYRVEGADAEVLATVDYCGTTTASAGRDHVMAVQFHPEKSQTAGFRLLKNFLAY
jgi:imidazole glycerol-phosphate synthase subunit HisH